MAYLSLTPPATIQALVDAEPQDDQGTAIVHTREPAQKTTLTPSMRNVRPNEAVGAQRAPDPIRQGDTPARPAQMPIAVSQAIAPIRSVMRNEFWIRLKLRRPLGAHIPEQGQAAFVERVNIRRPAAEAYGSLFTLDPPDRYTLY